MAQLLAAESVATHLLKRSYRGQTRMTCSIDHEAENAIPIFLCVACNRENIMTKENRQTLDRANNAICAAAERVQALEPAGHVR